MKDENIIQQEVQIEAKKFNCTLMRNNSGALKNKNGQPVRYGLGNVSKKRNDKIKSSDLIGITKIVVTQEMVGMTLGIFTATEVKEESWNPDKKLDAREQAQKAFIDWVISEGGLAGFVNSVDKLPTILEIKERSLDR